ncbi:MAG: hypothetical protein GH150_00015 [Hadesarchaea archaeon]|nr:hypothetical protein [Hadesarchaea archaeon]
MDTLEPLVGKLVKVVYSDGGEVKVRKGTLVGVDNQFLTLQTFNHTYAIGRACVTEIKTLEEERGP